MKRLLLVVVTLVVGQVIFGLEAVPKKGLVVYEETNASLDPWLDLFRDELSGLSMNTDQRAAAKLKDIDFSAYDFVIVYGAVMGFTVKEPIRDWLETKPGLSGRNVRLFVTANRWFVQDYRKRLVELLAQCHSPAVDVVAAATEKLTLDDKRRLVHQFVAQLEPAKSP